MYNGSNNTLINGLRKFLAEEKIDFLLVNSTNEFLLEYNRLEDCARYHLTGFSGSTGEALISVDNIWLFVDGRYHEQADNEVNKLFVNVVKLKMTDTLTSQISKIVSEGKTLALVSKKISLNFYNNIKKNLPLRKIVLLDYDPIMQRVKAKDEKNVAKIEKIPLEFCGRSIEQKFGELAGNLSDNEAVLVTKLEDVAYFTNCRSYNFPYFAGFEAKMLVEKNRVNVFCDGEIPSLPNSFIVHPLEKFDSYLENSTLNIKVEIPSISLYDYKLIKNPVPIEHSIISDMKSVKTNEEINHLKRCFKASDKVFEVVKNSIKEGISELELAQIVEEEFKKQGARALSFKTILAVGENSSIIHYSYPSSNKKVQNGDMILLDCGAYFEGGLSTDATRTFICGAPSSLQKDVYTTVLKTFFAAYSSKTAQARELDKIGREICKFEGFDFPHGLGHGVGVSVHEAPPVISMRSNDVLKENMVFTIEPGLYKSECFGVRLENTVFFDGERFQSFSSFEFEEKLINYDMLDEGEKKLLEDWQKQA